jgi:hypothetical protein
MNLLCALQSFQFLPGTAKYPGCSKKYGSEVYVRVSGLDTL